MIPLFKPYMPASLPDLDSILYSGALAYGKWGHEFEQRVSKYVGNPLFLATNSFNAAYLVLLKTLDLKPGDEVIGSPMTCLASNQPFAASGINVVWADIDPETGMLEIDDVCGKISSKTKAVLMNHFCGYVADVDTLLALCKQYGLYVIEDAIEGFGAEYKGKKAGNLGADATVYSFQTVRLPNTIDGGAVSFKDETLYKKALKVRDYGINRTRFRDDMNEINPTCDITVAGYGATPSEISSYIGSLQMEVIEELLEKQRKRATVWNEYLMSRKDVKSMPIVKGATPNYWVYGVLANQKRQFMEDMRTNGYYASGVHLPNNFYSIFGQQKNLKGVSEFYSKFVALPCGWWVDK